MASTLRELRARFAVWAAPRDGNCLFTSLAVQMLLRQTKYAAGEREIIRLALRLREFAHSAVVDETGVNFKPNYRPFFSAGEEGTFAVETPEQYLSGLRSGKVFGGDLELTVLAKDVLRSPICVYDVSVRGVRAVNYQCLPGDTFPDDLPFCLLRRGLHFDALIPRP